MATINIKSVIAMPVARIYRINVKAIVKCGNEKKNL